ncbi:ATP-binding protein [Cellulomonas sp. NTE-D12]|uniref:sacsin N-terminal ATP-binding-like domain-containing protein n=1 Tax=Cellulomonas sp. NTE-D12 TaxID=2962632 RepID=UPI003081FF19|nr:hypothetical protein CELD12_05550 [Cellulomonas sp. NTE-D12]
MTVDAFDTARLRAAVLTAWRSSPARLREDANTEEDHARGYYRDRVVVELAQNAADAATRAGVPGRLLLRLDHADDGAAVLVAANTGAPLDAAGVASLSSMRASAKRPEAGLAHTGVVGRFGVGFAAVRAVSDEVDVLSTSGGVRFSLADTRSALTAAAQTLPELAQEVRRRDGSLPALRLPWSAEGRPPLGYDTAVVLHLRDEVAADEVRGLLDEVDDALLIALPGLVEILVEVPDAAPRRIADVTDRWVLSSAEGEVPLALVADRPVEERSARSWRVTWGVPRAAGSGGPQRPVTWRHVVHAPTATDDPITVPALLVATLPLDPTRRHVALGPLADAVLEHAAEAYARLAELLAQDGHEPLALVPVGLPAGALDSRLHQHLVARLASTPLLRSAGGARLVAPDSAVAVDGPPGVETALGRLVPGLVSVPVGLAAQARTLGVDVVPLSDLVEGLPAVRDADWAAVYTGLDAVASDGRTREALAGLPVPLADGRVVRGARGAVLLPAGAADRLEPTTLESLARWGLRVVDPGAAHPLLERLGAAAPDLAGLLAHDAVRLAVLAQADDDDLDVADEVTDAVLDLVGAVLADGGRPPTAPWLGLLTLPAADGEPTPAHGLVLPGSTAARLLDDRVLAPVAVATVERWGAEVLTAVGVRADLVLVPVDGVLADPAALDPGATDAATLAAQSLDAWPDYLAHLGENLSPGAYVGDLVAVADLDAVADDSWPAVLDRLAGEPALRAALLDPVRDEHGRRAEPYTAWWLRTRSGLVTGGPFALPSGADEGVAATSLEPGGTGPSAPSATPVDDAVRTLLPPVPEALAEVDPAVLRVLGGVATLAELDADGWVPVLDGLPSGRGVDPAVAVAVWRALATLAEADGPPVAPERVPALVAADRVAAVHVEDAAVADSPQWLQRVDVAAMVPVPPTQALALAGLLDLPLASDLTTGEVDQDDAVEQPVPVAARALVDGPTTWWEHEDLRVDGAAVDWWVDADGGLHATTLAGLAAALAQASGRWSRRWALETVLTEPGRAAEVRLGEASESDPA